MDKLLISTEHVTFWKRPSDCFVRMAKNSKIISSDGRKAIDTFMLQAGCGLEGFEVVEIHMHS